MARQFRAGSYIRTVGGSSKKALSENDEGGRGRGRGGGREEGRRGGRRRQDKEYFQKQVRHPVGPTKLSGEPLCPLESKTLQKMDFVMHKMYRASEILIPIEHRCEWRNEIAHLMHLAITADEQ